MKSDEASYSQKILMKLMLPNFKFFYKCPYCGEATYYFMFDEYPAIGTAIKATDFYFPDLTQPKHGDKAKCFYCKKKYDAIRIENICIL
jgi:uncharacterized Zn-finger protein